MPSISRWQAGLAGLLAAASALAVSELLAGAIGAVPSLILSVGNLVVDSTPPVVEDLAIDLFGTNDKLALFVGMGLVAGAAGVAVGLVAARRFASGVWGIVAFGLLAAVAALADPAASALAGLLSAAMSVGAGVLVLRLLLRAGTAEEPGASRRAFLRTAGSVALGAVAVGAFGRYLVTRTGAAFVGREDVELPEAAEEAPVPPDAASLEVAGLGPIVTPNDEFYRIDTALMVPRVNVDGWRLRVTGLVERQYEMDFEELSQIPMVERYMTLACVSNEVGGELVDNALWLGVPLPDVLDRAGVHPSASQIVGRSVDGFTVGFPTEAAYDGREALVAIGMNGEPLPYDHGFPARLVVAGLYGYVSATKWLTEIELTTWEAFDAYWVPRGWAKEGPVKTQSRIDVPRNGASLSTGTQAIAGVAWAQNRGIARVEVQVDDQPWQEARLSEPLSEDAWVQWVLEWEATQGRHRIRVRATDATGETQTEMRQPTRPDGATGYHTIDVQVG